MVLRLSWVSMMIQPAERRGSHVRLSGEDSIKRLRKMQQGKGLFLE
jgi:hypothetical protein